MRTSILILVAIILSVSRSLAQPANDNCANATVLTVDGALLCGQTTSGATTQAGEHCAASGGGITPRTVWYRFVATSTSLTLNVLRTNNINCYGYLSVYGPNPTCMPGAGSAILSCVLMNGDPGYYPMLTGLTVGATYFINYNGQGCGGSGDAFHNFCIGVYSVATNNTVNAPTIIDECGIAFNGSTQGGYSVSGSGTGGRNLDNNNATTCPSCGAQPGADVPFVVNNDSWFTFCSASGGTWTVNFNVGSCVFSGLNSGLQMAVFTGSASALTWHSQAPNPTYSRGSWTSPNIVLGAGQCAYLMVDGFAGDACSYSYTLTNVSGGCILLPIQLLWLRATHENGIHILNWATASELNNDYYTVERSDNGVDFKAIGTLIGAGTTQRITNYQFVDERPVLGTNYYRIKQTDFDGNYTYTDIVALFNNSVQGLFINHIYPNPAKESINLSIVSKLNGKVSLEVFDAHGKRLVNDYHQILSGEMEIKLSIEDLVSGIYFIRLTNSETGISTTSKFSVD